MTVTSVNRFRSFQEWSRAEYGCRVHRLCLDGGFTCPNRDGFKARGGCTFCDSAGSGALHIARGDQVRNQVMTQLTAARRRYGARKFIAYFQAFTGTYAPVEVLRETYEEALCHPDIVGLGIGTRSDCVTPAACDLIASFRDRVRVWLEIGLQSVNQATLDGVNRAESVEDFPNAAAMARAAGLDVVVHLLFGLPGDTAGDCLAAVDAVNAAGAVGVKIHNLCIDSRAPMTAAWCRGEIRTFAESEYVGLVCDAIERLDPRVLVHRLVASAPRERHLAPLWALEKQRVLSAINAELSRRGTRQGSRFAAEGGIVPG